MSFINDNEFQKFFFWGIDNKEEVLTQTIYFAYKEVYAKYELDKYIFLLSEEQKQQVINQIIQTAKNRYIQFFRFVILNDQKGIYSYEQDNNIAIKNIEEKIQQLINAGDLFVCKAGVYLSKNFTANIKEYYVNFNKETAKVEIYKNWVKPIYQITSQLEALENSNQLEYYEIWLKTKLERAKNRHEDFDANEIKDVEIAIQKFQERKTKIQEYAEKQQR